MIRALQVRPELGGDFKIPEDGLVTYDIDPLTGAIAESGATNVRHELFLKGTEPGTAPPPDSSNPDTSKPPTTNDSDASNPPPAPKPPGVEPKVSSPSSDYTTLPPEARRRISKENPTPTPEGKKEEKKNDRSFLRKVIDSLGITSTETKSESSEAQPAAQKQSDAVKPAATSSQPANGKQTSFSIEVCSVTGLLPVDNVCKSRERRRFTLGSEPKTYCSAERHRGH